MEQGRGEKGRRREEGILVPFSRLLVFALVVIRLYKYVQRRKYIEISKRGREGEWMKRMREGRILKSSTR